MTLSRARLGATLLTAASLAAVAATVGTSGASAAVVGPIATTAGEADSVGSMAASGWQVVPDSTPDRDQALWQDVSATGPNDVWAVGLGREYDVRDGIAQHWDGQQWSRVAVPDAGDGEGELHGVAAVAPNDVWAVGKHFQGSSWHWNGSAWSAVEVPGRPDPDQGSDTTNFLDVAATSSTDVWAVGFRRNELVSPTTQRPEIIHWNGSAWSQVKAPSIPGRSQFNAVDTVSASRAWAVGSTEDPSTGVRTAVTARWNGTAWKRVALPALPAESTLTDVTVVAPGDIWAVGRASGHPIALHWSGSRWKVVATPSVDGGLTAVAPDGNGGLWATGGTSEDVYAAGATYFLHWDGSAWTTVPDPAGTEGALWGLTLVPGTQTVWAVGAEKSSGYENPDPGRIEVNSGAAS